MTSGYSPDDALLPAPILFNPGAKYAGPTRRWQGVPGIERAGNGRLWAAWYSGGEGEGGHNHVLLVSSEDDGRSWSAPHLVIDPPGVIRAFDPVLWIAPSGRLFLYWSQSIHLYDGRLGVWEIHTDNPGDANPAWSTPRRMFHGIMMNKPTVTSAGAWLFPVAIWPVERAHMGIRHHPDPEFAGLRFSCVYVSHDAGKTFSLLGKADVPGRNVDEHMIVERRDGSLWMLVRLIDGIGESFSFDGGATWSPGARSKLAGPGSRFFIRRLRSGRLLLVNHHEFVGRNNLTAFLSDDDGATWPAKLLLDARNLVSYPDGVEDPGGNLWIIYDRERKDAKEVLLARITEADILAGRLVTRASQLQMMVDDACRA